MTAGRPTKMTPEVVQKLEEAFAIGCTDVEACLYVGITKTTLYKYQDENPEFADRKQALKETPVLKARSNVMKDLEGGDIDTSKWYLERKRKKEFSTKTESEITGANGDPLTMVIEDCRNRSAGLPSEDK